MRKLAIAYANSRKAVKWTNSFMPWSKFKNRLNNHLISNETLSEYLKMSKKEQNDLKDVGGFVGGSLLEGKRTAKNVEYRDLITFDLDYLPAEEVEKLIGKLQGLQFAFSLYSTRKHTPDKPRLRLIIPLKESVNVEEYEPCARLTAKALGVLDYCDQTTFEPSRLMYFPSACFGAEVINVVNYPKDDNRYLDGRALLATIDWHDINNWPSIRGERPITHLASLGKKQKDPTQKDGVIGAFCKAYSISEVIETYLADVYEEVEDGRYTYTKGSTVGGALTYEDKWLYSHHATDPASLILCNAFDLVRLHLFYELDQESKDDTPVNKLPSFLAMEELVKNDEKAQAILQKEYEEKRQERIASIKEQEDASDWLSTLKKMPRSDMLESSINNVAIILRNDENLKGKIFFNEFSQRFSVYGYLPWEDENTQDKQEDRTWSDADDAALRHYLESVYEIRGKEKIADALTITAQNQKIHPIKDFIEEREWDEKKRVETAFIDFLGCEDSVYTREVAKMFFTAAVARIYKPGIKFDDMIIIGGRQGIGKSTFVQKLALDRWYSDSMQTFIGKEACEQIQGVWLCEIPELHSFAKAEVNAIKHFLSKKEDYFREAYGRRTERKLRRCVFIGTTNDTEYLRDATGERRFLPIDANEQRATKSVFKDLDHYYVQQLWAEALKLYKNGQKLHLEGEAAIIAKEKQKEHKEVDPRQGIILDYLDKRLPPNWSNMELGARRMYLEDYSTENEAKGEERLYVSAIEIWCECFLEPKQRFDKKSAYSIKNIMRTLEGWKEEKKVARTRLYGPQRLFKKDLF